MVESWPQWVIAGVPVLLLVAAALVWHRGLVRLRGREPMPYCRARTADGADLALYRCGQPTGQPLILIAGFASSHMYWDFESPRLAGEPASVSGYLADHGFDVWTFDYRGHGRSRAPSVWSSYGFEQLVREDLATVVQKVLQSRPDCTPSDLHLVGHSVGAVAALVYLSERGESYGRSVMLAPPVALAESTRLARWIVRNRTIISTWPVVAFGSFARWMPYAFAALQPAMARQFITSGQTSAGTFLRWSMTALSDVSARLTIEIMGWIAHHGARWQRRSVQELMRQCRTEIRYVTSRADALVGSDAFGLVRAILPSQASWEDVSPDSAMGHCDLLLGREALDRVWQPLVRWLRAGTAAK